MDRNNLTWTRKQTRLNDKSMYVKIQKMGNNRIDTKKGR